MKAKWVCDLVDEVKNHLPNKDLLNYEKLFDSTSQDLIKKRESASELRFFHFLEKNGFRFIEREYKTRNGRSVDFLMNYKGKEYGIEVYRPIGKSKLSSKLISKSNKKKCDYPLVLCVEADFCVVMWDDIFKSMPFVFNKCQHLFAIGIIDGDCFCMYDRNLEVICGQEFKISGISPKEFFFPIKV